jgi:hypothetical protein
LYNVRYVTTYRLKKVGELDNANDDDGGGSGGGGSGGGDNSGGRRRKPRWGVGDAAGPRKEYTINTKAKRFSDRYGAVGSAIALVTFIRVLCCDAP